MNALQLSAPSLIGDTCYATLRLPGGTIYATDSQAFEAEVTARWTHYAIALTETPAGSGFWEGSLPANLPPPPYTAEYFLQEGDAPAVGDLALGSEQILVSSSGDTLPPAGGLGAPLGAGSQAWQLIVTLAATVTAATLTALIDPNPSSYGSTLESTPIAVAVSPSLPITLQPIGGGAWICNFSVPQTSVFHPLNYALAVTDSIAGAVNVGGVTLPRYIEMPDATILAASIPAIPSFAAATILQQYFALAQATLDVDTAMRYQGRKYDLNQTLQFPRIPYDTSQRLNSGAYNNMPVLGPLASDLFPGGDVLWDWDQINLIPLMPQRVQIATILQADSLLDGSRAKTIDLLYDGLVNRSAGGVREMYDRVARVPDTLCRRANQIMSYYRIRQGRIL